MMNLTAFFTFEDGRRIMASAYQNNDYYLGLTEIDPGSTLELTFLKGKGAPASACAACGSLPRLPGRTRSKEQDGLRRKAQPAKERKRFFFLFKNLYSFFGRPLISIVQDQYRPMACM